MGVWIAGLKVGHLPAETAATYQLAVLAKIQAEDTAVAFMARLVGGDSDRPNIGVLLYHDPTELGLPSQASDDPVHGANRNRGQVLTGSAAAELAWTDELPPDRIAAIKHLRKELDRETDPLERHFLFLELEKVLYKCRDVFESALAEFEATCLQHDSEMETVCERLSAFHGGIPALPTYKQMAIMKQKAGNYEEALWWAERGLLLCGDQGFRDDFVDDLKQRTAKYRRRLAT